LPLGTVIDTGAGCPFGDVPGSDCGVYTVQCPGVADLDVALRVAEPTSTPLGTVMFGTGGGGTSFYEGDAEALAIMNELSALGWRVVQRAWSGADGWVASSAGMAASACRYATLATYVHDTFHTDPTTGFCITGNSGGAAEIAYALARYGRGDVVDLAVPTGGPPMGRLDHGCLDDSDAAWIAECDALVASDVTTCSGGPANGPDCDFSNNARDLIDAAYAPATPCDDADESARATLLADSVASPDAALDYPNTRVHFLFGDDDCTEAVPLGLAYASLVTSDSEIEFVSAPHAVFSTSAGAAAIRDVILGECTPR
jgi:hypothetical protein